MCGIAGFAGWRLPPGSAERAVRSMNDAIVHRGPDEDGYHVAPGVALGMRRLSIIDVSGGRQPIANEDGTVHVVFNGEIYNHHALRTELERKGHRFATHADTETLVHLYEEHGDAFVSRLRGMFTFAIWDDRRSRLLLGRDRLGIKPLYYWMHDGGIAFASELWSLRALDGFAPAVDEDAVASYLAFGYVPDPQCIHAGVRKLPPAHTLSWEAGRAHEARYWTPVVAERRISEQDAVAELRVLLADAVASHLESEVPLGAFLSGGLDSSTVVAEMARVATIPVRTFSIGFDEAAFNEAPHAAEVARALGTQHTELIVRPDADALVNDVIAAFDEPFADSSALPTYLVSRLAREHVTVALSGDGGDELFAGYTRYGTALGRPELPAALRASAGVAGRALPHGARGRGLLLDMARRTAGRYAGTVALPLDVRDGGVATDAVASRLGDMSDWLAPWFDQVGARDRVTQLTMVDAMTYLPGDILTKVDRMSMAVSLEARVPLLDHPLVEFAMSLPGALKLRDGTGKWIFRQAIEGIVPPSVLTKRKQGFSVPLARWFRNELSHRVESLLAADAPMHAWTDARAVARVAREHRTGRRDHSHLIWRLLVLNDWLGRSAASVHAASQWRAPNLGGRRAPQTAGALSAHAAL